MFFPGQLKKCKLPNTMMVDLDTTKCKSFLTSSITIITIWYHHPATIKDKGRLLV